MRSGRNREAGAVSVEFALVTIFALLPLVLGSLHFGRVLGVRHRLAEATGYATRAAAIAKRPADVKTIIETRMGASDCSSIVVTSAAVGAPPYRRLEVTAKCNLKPAFGAAILGAVGPNDITVVAAMPY